MRFYQFLLVLGLCLGCSLAALGFSNDVTTIDLSCSHPTVHVDRTDLTLRRAD